MMETVDDVWNEIHQVWKKRSDGDVILEDFMVKSGVSLDISWSLSSSMRLETSEEKIPQCVTPPMALPPTPLVGSLLESTVIKRQRDNPGEREGWGEWSRTVRKQANILNCLFMNLMLSLYRFTYFASCGDLQAYQSELLSRILMSRRWKFKVKEREGNSILLHFSIISCFFYILI